MTHVLEYSPHDTWFFRESRPHNAVGAQELASLFPPPVRTLAGALRTLIGDAADADWQAYARDDGHPLRERIGFGTDPGPLRFLGAFICKDSEVLYPAPANLLRTPRNEVLRLALGAAAECDLGRTRLPTLKQPAEGAKPIEGSWLSEVGFNAFLNGNVPPTHTVIAPHELYAEEARLGIAMNTGARAAAHGMLYQTRHLRLASLVGERSAQVTVRLGVDGLDEAAQAALPAFVRLGGEGRPAGLALAEGGLVPAMPDDCEGASGFIVTTLTPAQPGTTPGLPPAFERVPAQDHDVWRGRLAGVALTIHGAAVGKPLRLGGWNMAGPKRGPEPVRSLLPGGTIWYCTADEMPNAQAAAQIHGNTIDPNERWGQGLLTCGPWLGTENRGETA